MPNTNSVNCDGELSKTYTDYIKTHMDIVQAKCKQINICIGGLLEDENILTVLSGYNLSLNKTCRLVYKSATEPVGNISGKCTSKDREDIHDHIEEHMVPELVSNKPHWKTIKTCLHNNYGDADVSTNVEKICGLAHNKTQVCSGGNVQLTLRTFFNSQIEHLQCLCRTLKITEDTSVPVPILVGAAVGGILLLLALFVIGCICYRRRKSRKRKNKAPNVVYVHAPIAEGCPVYQEIMDDGAYQGYSKSPSTKPPTLPSRYTDVSPNMFGRTQMTFHEDEQKYLDPVTVRSNVRPRLPIPGQANPGYGAPPDYREREASGGADSAKDYFEPLPSPTEEEDKGYDTLGRSKSINQNSELVSKIKESNLASVPKSEDIPLGPVPAKRTKKDDREADSHYFILEKDRESQTES